MSDKLQFVATRKVIPPLSDKLKFVGRLGQWESPALNNAGLSNLSIRFVFRERLAELFSGLFFVAASRLNSPRSLQAY
jgi:hypothetical protein